MTYIDFFKLQAKNLFKDFKTKEPYFDGSINAYLYEYSPSYFDIDAIILDFDIDEEKFSLMKAQHIIAHMVGFRKWTDILKASDEELELAKLLFDNQDKIFIEDWNGYITSAIIDHNIALNAEAKLKIFKEVILSWKSDDNAFPDYRLHGRRKSHH